MLQVLTLEDNNLATLPAGLALLTSLTRLSVAGNELHTIQQGILGRLPALAHLALGRNLLTSLPGDIGGASNLVSLDVAGNRLR